MYRKSEKSKYMETRTLKMEIYHRYQVGKFPYIINPSLIEIIIILTKFLHSPQSKRSEQTVTVVCKGYFHWVCFGGSSSEMSKFGVPWRHFLRLFSGYRWFWWWFITEIWSVHHKISYSSIEFALGKGVFSNVINLGAVVTLFKDSDDISLQKYGQFIILWLCSSMDVL